MRILIVDDDPTATLLLRKALERLGHEVLAASDGHAALGVLQQSRPAVRLVISDWMMPRLSGIELCRTLRESGNAYVYFLLLTSRGGVEDRREALAAGADDFLVKPFDRDELLARLEVAGRVLRLMEDAESRSSQVKKLSDQLRRRSDLPAERLLSEGIVDAETLRQAQRQQSRTGQSLAAILIANGCATEELLTCALARYNDMPFVDIAKATPDPDAILRIDRATAERLMVLPLAGNLDAVVDDAPVEVAVADPYNVDGIDHVQRTLKKRVVAVLAAPSALTSAIANAYRDVDAAANATALLKTLDTIDSTQVEELDTGSGSDVDDAPVVRLLNALLSEAARRRASDIHIEPSERDAQVRFRIDGDLVIARTLPRSLMPGLVSRLKVLSDLDIAERRMPQDGRLSIVCDNRRIDLRLSTLPVQFGERVVARLLDRANATLAMDQLCLSDVNRHRFEHMIRHPHGIVLVTGPTGSGKTTTLYATLNALKSPTTNILTCEDPIEYQLDGISQSAVNEAAGLTFAKQLRAILRQDPDVVLVGEIRDAETAEIAFKAALTGHLVFSTLHCNEAAGAPARLIDMGVPDYLVGSALLGVLAQRLVRRLCPHCKKPLSGSAEPYQYLANIAGESIEPDNYYETGGCDVCDRAGMRGRLGVHELLLVNDEFRSTLRQTVETRTLRDVAVRGGMVPLVNDGLLKAREGLTVLEEVQRRLISA